MYILPIASECKLVLSQQVFPGGSDAEESACNARDWDSIPGWGSSLGGGHGNPLQYSCLENPMDGEPGGLQCMLLHRVVPGASMRNSAHGKGHEEGAFGICKGGLEPQETPCSRASTPQTRVYLLYCFMLSPTPLTLWGAVPHRFSQRRSKLAAPVNKNSWA